MGQPAFAKDFTQRVVEQLQEQGFASIVVERTLLGRTRILADSQRGRREIILNPRTGEILRDLWTVTSDGSGGGGLIRDDDAADDDSGRGRGRGRGGDDGDDDSRDDNGDGDNSGKGGGSDDDK
ncbi:hypothetical protein G3572_16820 [Rhodobacter sp. ETT8]|uniref:Uncharacterized protein n=1 Tax=Pseudotabrizicola algicola TaxID=2709381 RepID=A0A6B3RVH5_9RHOB|nr:hypothetical protein [Pseudotabrizicola algicola]